MAEQTTLKFDQDKWTKERIQALLETNDQAVGRALVRLLERQTFDEQQSSDTKYQNGKGFRPCHARLGTSMATYFMTHNRLTPKQAAYWRVKDKSGNTRIGIYANQLLAIMKESK